MKTLLMFPGQGSQYLGMCNDIYKSSFYAKKLFQKTKDILQIDFADIIFNTNNEILSKSYITQPAIALVSVSIYLTLIERYKANIDKLNIQGVIGHSLGEYSALCVAKYLPFEEMIKFLQKRGQAMYDCAKENTGMCAIIGCDKERIQTSINNIMAKCLVIANTNSKEQIVVSGYLDDIKKLKTELSTKAKRMIDLSVSGAFHSPLMKTAQDSLQDDIASLKLLPSNIAILQNYSGKFETDIKTIQQNLKQQITSPILFYENIQTAIQCGFDTFIEIGPKNVLSSLVKRCITKEQLDNVNIYKIENLEDVNNFQMFLDNIQ